MITQSQASLIRPLPVQRLQNSALPRSYYGLSPEPRSTFTDTYQRRQLTPNAQPTYANSSTSWKNAFPEIK